MLNYETEFAAKKSLPVFNHTYFVNPAENQRFHVTPCFGVFMNYLSEANLTDLLTLYVDFAYKFQNIIQHPILDFSFLSDVAYELIRKVF